MSCSDHYDCRECSAMVDELLAIDAKAKAALEQRALDAEARERTANANCERLAKALSLPSKAQLDAEARADEWRREVERRDELLAGSSPEAIREQVESGVHARHGDLLARLAEVTRERDAAWQVANGLRMDIAAVQAREAGAWQTFAALCAAVRLGMGADHPTVVSLLERSDEILKRVLTSPALTSPERKPETLVRCAFGHPIWRGPTAEAARYLRAMCPNPGCESHGLTSDELEDEDNQPTAEAVPVPVPPPATVSAEEHAPSLLERIRRMGLALNNIGVEFAGPSSHPQHQKDIDRIRAIFKRHGIESHLWDDVLHPELAIPGAKLREPTPASGLGPEAVRQVRDVLRHVRDAVDEGEDIDMDRVRSGLSLLDAAAKGGGR